MAEEEKKTSKVKIITLILIVILLALTLTFLWYPERFRQAVQDLNDALKKGVDKTKSVFTKKDEEEKEG